MVKLLQTRVNALENITNILPMFNNIPFLYQNSFKFWFALLYIQLLTILYLVLYITTLRGDWRKFIADIAPITPHVFVDEYCAIGPKDMGQFSENHYEFNLYVEKLPADCYCWVTLDFWQGFESSTARLPYIYLKNAKTTILTTVQCCTHSIFNEFKENYDPILTHIGHQYQGLPCEEVTVVCNIGEPKTSAWKRKIQETIANENANGWTNEQIGILIVRPILYLQDDHTVALKKALEEEEENVTSYYDYEVLSQEWPVVIICLPSKEYQDLAMVQSRAIAKIIYVSFYTNIAIGRIQSSRTLAMSLSCLVLRKRIDVLTYHQEIHTNEQLQEAETLSEFMQSTKSLVERYQKKKQNLIGHFTKDFLQQVVSKAIHIFEMRIW